MPTTVQYFLILWAIKMDIDNILPSLFKTIHYKMIVGEGKEPRWQGMHQRYLCAPKVLFFYFTLLLFFHFILFLSKDRKIGSSNSFLTVNVLNTL